ncbi:class I SAM-dependent methyltransferase [Aliifodinibius sp. S!AR15-10]|uniref:class I SAM-dependent methyltransferase n=1 Tax=Aliifodinibius sp. S!AR15-10 TaxID=2950437 RepID=UPI002860C40E|nr:class I SAM-dependent methyltransferase [Aliifodinibius sp. S!AR15-10]MDR8391153.1 class I SAM-dependent methyltransferase [Aliifodinibius sp. S!AR15-10]
MQPNQISQTAAFIAIKFYGLTQTDPYRSWFDEKIIRFYDRLVQFLPKPLHLYHSVLKKKWIRRFFLFSEELLLPGDLMHIIMRKYFIGQQVDQLLDSGYEQLLVLGAGFDHLAMLHSQKGTCSFEIDAPGMASLKEQFIKQHGMQNANLHLLSHHVSEGNNKINLELIPPLDPNRKTVIVAEGFFDYLYPEQSKKILEDLVTFFNNKATLISTIFALDELSVVRRSVFKAGVTMVGEKIRLGWSKEEYESTLDSVGFGNTRMLNASTMRQKLLVPADISMPVLDGFYLVSSKV